MILVDKFIFRGLTTEVSTSNFWPISFYRLASLSSVTFSYLAPPSSSVWLYVSHICSTSSAAALGSSVGLLLRIIVASSVSFSTWSRSPSYLSNASSICVVVTRSLWLDTPPCLGSFCRMIWRAPCPPLQHPTDASHSRSRDAAPPQSTANLPSVDKRATDPHQRLPRR